MKYRRHVFLGVLTALAIGYIISIAPNLKHRSEMKRAIRVFQSIPKDRISSALHTFVRIQEATNGVVAATVSLSELVSGGHLRIEEAEAFKGTTAAFLTTADGDEGNPQEILAEARLSDGSIVVMFSDGSIGEITGPPRTGGTR